MQHPTEKCVARVELGEKDRDACEWWIGAIYSFVCAQFELVCDLLVVFVLVSVILCFA